MEVTIKQIAEIAGVHRSTVDKVLHNRDGVSATVREKVQDIINALGYKPNMIGKALKFKDKRFVIAVLLLKVDSTEEIRAGIEKAYSEYKDFGLEIEYYTTNNSDVAEQLNIINLVNTKNISGLIISPLDDINIRNAIDEMVDGGIPVITTNSDIMECKRLCFVGQDVESAGRVAGNLMGEILGGKGKVAIITGAHNMLCVSTRVESFEKIIKSNYPGIEIIDVIETYDQELVVFQKTMSILECVKDLKGIYITCGSVSEVGKAVRLKNKAKHVKIISFDLYPAIVELVKEGIVNFTIGQDLFTQGYKPVKILFEYLFSGIYPEVDFIKTAIDIRIKENIDIG